MIEQVLIFDVIISPLLGMISICGEINSYIMGVYFVIEKMNLRGTSVQRDIFKPL